MKSILGLDLGVNSIGWAIVNEAETPDELSQIIKLGVRTVPLSVDEKSNFEKGKANTTNVDRRIKLSTPPGELTSRNPCKTLFHRVLTLIS